MPCAFRSPRIRSFSHDNATSHVTRVIWPADLHSLQALGLLTVRATLKATTHVASSWTGSTAAWSPQSAHLTRSRKGPSSQIHGGLCVACMLEQVPAQGQGETHFGQHLNRKGCYSKCEVMLGGWDTPRGAADLDCAADCGTPSKWVYARFWALYLATTIPSQACSFRRWLSQASKMLTAVLCGGHLVAC